ncbi:hypothetical protein DMB42_40355 [Nonomuraea sp. WAC 01424]|uniref:three-Cys-motif partner protein TcmP n=1 Tax=Nonomuraea sp. WAC 01424 TaxID=2203200 RepID=UPI000F7AEFD7|nr:three-Cys-motif partner protein TcmP [Nonomuraea sp. WAC 01424]RSN01235.1 hypothetical protein DMB42_40355 [Nonomuraea sp. WAC 01424]
MVGPKTTHWKLEPHTKAKHEILRGYLNGWFPVMSRYNDRIFFFDGFAGPGRYENGEAGSPIIALTTLLDHAHFSKMECDFLFMFCEHDPKRFASLEAEIEKLQNARAPWPRNVKVQLVNEEFEARASNIVTEMKRLKKQLVPTFAFVDPFGVSGLPIAVIKDLLASPRCELFVNYMVDSVNRFAGAGNIDHHLRDLFGTERYKEAANLQGQPRQLFLHDLYEEQLKSTCEFPFVQSFAMINSHGHIGYYLFYGTRDIKGLEIMKDSMWKIDPGGDYRFSDRLVGQTILFIEDGLDVRPLRQAILTEFAGKAVPIQQLEEFTISRTPYRKSHLRRPVLTPMEKENVIQVRRPGKSGFPPGTIVLFPA